MYRFVECGTLVDGVLRFQYYIQGCNLSGMIFAMVVDPFLNKFVAEAEDTRLAVVRACADDIGAALRDIRTLAILKPTFDNAKRYAGLALKPRKCILVPTSQRLDAGLAVQIQAWLVENLTEWKDLRVKTASRYLGFLMGTETNASQFDAPMGKWKSRSAAIAVRHSAASVSVLQYNSRAVPVLGYKMQLAIPPSKLFRREATALTHVLHLATGALDVNAFFNLSVLGGPKIKSLKAMSVATLTRTAVKTITSWQQDYDVLLANADALPLTTRANGTLWSPYWDTPSIAALLRHAARGFPESEVAALGVDHGAWILRDAQKIRAAVQAPLQTLRKYPQQISKLQRHLVENATAKLHPPALTTLFAKRLTTSFKDHFRVLPPIDWARTFSVLRAASSHEAMCFVKSISNSWTKSSRFHDNKIDQCAFGCRGAPDDLAHYLCCPWLWTEVDEATQFDIDLDPDNVHQRLLVASASCDRVRRLTVAFSVYHAIKCGHLGAVQRAIAGKDFSEVLRLTSEAAAAFATKFAAK
jgi:hypothetical protein